MTPDDMLEGRVAIQKDLNRLEMWVHANLMKFKKDKCKVLHLGHGHPQNRCRLSGEWVKNSPAENALGMLMGEDQDVSHRCVLAAQKVNHILGFIRRSMSSRSREGILLFYSAVVRPHLQCCICPIASQTCL